VEFERYVIALKRGDVCCQCGSDLPSGFLAAWEPYSRTVMCLECAGPNIIVNVHASSGPGPRTRGRDVA
jgi:hypothetical protein